MGESSALELYAILQKASAEGGGKFVAMICALCLSGVEHEKDNNLPLFVELNLETMFLLRVCAVRILSKTMQNPTQ
jgi:hypothetical protein